MIHKNEKLFIKENQKQDLKENENFGGNNCNKHLVYKWLLEINKKKPGVSFNKLIHENECIESESWTLLIGWHKGRGVIGYCTWS